VLQVTQRQNDILHMLKCFFCSELHINNTL